MLRESIDMHLIHGNLKAGMFQFANSITPLLWSFQIHGWSACIPCAALVVQKFGPARPH